MMSKNDPLLNKLAEGTKAFRQMVAQSGRLVRAGVCGSKAIKAIRAQLPDSEQYQSFKGMNIFECEVMGDDDMYFFATDLGARSFIEMVEQMHSKGVPWEKIKEYVSTGQQGLSH